MNKNEMLNDKPIFVAKSRAFYCLTLAAIFLMFALLFYSIAQKSEAHKLKQVLDWFCVGLFGVGGVGTLYITLIFKKNYAF